MWKLISPPSLSSAESSLEPSPRLESHLWLRASAHSAQKLYPCFFLCLPIRFQPTLLCVLCTCVCTHARIPKGCITLEVADRYLYSHDSRYTDSHLPSSTREREREVSLLKLGGVTKIWVYISLDPSARFTLLMAFPDLTSRKKDSLSSLGMRELCTLLFISGLVRFLNFSFLFFNLVALRYSFLFPSLEANEQFRFCTVGLILIVITNNI